MVIKVLHDGVEHSVDTDLKALKSILFAGRVLKRSKEEVDLIFDEIHARLKEELDYEHERMNLERFSEFFSDIPGIRAPKPLTELCTKRVLVMERLVGMRLEDFVQQASPKAKQRAADLLTTAFHEMDMFFETSCRPARRALFAFREPIADRFWVVIFR